MSDPARLGVRAYARHRGVTHPAVLKAIREGRIDLEPDGTIDRDKADARWAQSTRARGDATPTRPPRGGNHDAAVTAPPPGVTAPVDAAVTAAGNPAPDDGIGGGQTVSYARARAVREAFAARLAKLEYELKAGKLIDKDAAAVAFYGCARTVRDRLLAVPDRLAPVLAGLEGPAEIRDALDRELRSALESLAADLDRALQAFPAHGS